jgi:hypothetical protein
MADDEVTKVRIARNQATFREANERIEATAVALGFLVDEVPFICECSDPSCADLVRLTVDDYEEVRRNPRLFFVAPGHQKIAVGIGAAVVTEERPDLVLVEKIGVAGAVAEDLHGSEPTAPDTALPSA